MHGIGTAVSGNNYTKKKRNSPKYHKLMARCKKTNCKWKVDRRRGEVGVVCGQKRTKDEESEKWKRAKLHNL